MLTCAKYLHKQRSHLHLKSEAANLTFFFIFGSCSLSLHRISNVSGEREVEGIGVVEHLADLVQDPALKTFGNFTHSSAETELKKKKCFTFDLFLILQDKF